MRLTQLSRAGASLLSLATSQPAAAGAGPRQVGAATGVTGDTPYALQELLDAVQGLAQGPFAGAAHMRSAATALAADLEKLGPEARRLLQADLAPPHVDLEI
jgi:hypothetical protein